MRWGRSLWSRWALKAQPFPPQAWTAWKKSSCCRRRSLSLLPSHSPPPPCVFPPSSPTRPGWARLSGGGGGEGWGLFELHHLHFAKGGRGLACTHPHPHPHPFSRSAQGGGPLALLARHWWIRAGDCSSPQPPRLGRGGWVGAGPPPLAAFALADAERAGGQEAREGGGKSFSG